MSPRAQRRIALAALALMAVAGCASGSGPLARRRTTVGTLKASVAQLEAENERYRTRLTENEGQVTRLREQLTQERKATGELTARLDDARALLASQGIDDTPARPRRTASPEPYESPSAHTIPAGNPGNRSAPFAQIGGGPRAIEPAEDDLGANPIKFGAPTGAVNEDDLPVALPRSSSGTNRETPPASRDAPLRWMPITTGAVDSSTRR